MLLQKEVVKDNRGNEYYLIKPNRVNWVVEEIKTGKRVQGPRQMFTHVRWENPKPVEIDPRVRIGALVKVKADAGMRANPKFAADKDKTFVVIGFDGLEGFKCTELGGNARNSYWKIPTKDLEIA